VFDGFDQNLIGVFLIIFLKLCFEIEDSLHLSASPSHGSSISNQANIFLEVRPDCFGYRSYQSVAVWRQLRTKIERILIDNQTILSESDLEDVGVELNRPGVGWLGYDTIPLTRKKL